MNNQDNKPTQTANQISLSTLNETLFLDWQRIVDVSKNDKTHAERVFQEFIHLLESSHREQRSSKFYADKLNMTKSNLRKICQQTAGIPPTRCIHVRIMLEAIHKLSDSITSIKQIALDLGFEDAGYFVRFFKKHGGIPPNFYRDTALKSG